jgi:hypothetical protein
MANYNSLGLYISLYDQLERLGWGTVGTRKYHMIERSYISDGVLGAYNFTKSFNYTTYGYKNVIFFHEFTNEVATMRVTGVPGKDIYIATQDVYIRENYSAYDGFGGTAIDKSLVGKTDAYVDVASFSKDDILLCPFNSDVQIYFNQKEGTIYRLTGTGATDKLFRVDPSTPIEQVRSSIAFLDTFDLDTITKPYTGPLGLANSRPNSPKSPSKGNAASDQIETAVLLTSPNSYGTGTADIITNYNPKVNSPIQIDLSSFDGAAGTLKFAKKSKQVAKLAKKDLDFIYDRQAGYLYYNENGKEPGFGDGGILAILEGKPKVGMGNFEFM